MARTFTGRDAQRIADEHKALLERLSAGAWCFENYKDSIKRTADALIAEEVLNILKEIPIDELGRDRSGLRIKNLKDSGRNSNASEQARWNSTEFLQTIYCMSLRIKLSTGR